MKLGFYNPYLKDIVGGGERHFLTTAECLSGDHQIDLIFSPSKLPQKPRRFLSKLEKTFNLKLKNLNLVSGPFDQNDSILDRLKFTRQYDIFYYMTDGSFFMSRAKKNIVHFQIPFNIKPSLSQKLKLKLWPVKTSNSKFTKDHLEKHNDLHQDN